jgi:hypothetical protein
LSCSFCLCRYKCSSETKRVRRGSIPEKSYSFLVCGTEEVEEVEDPLQGWKKGEGMEFMSAEDSFA